MRLLSALLCTLTVANSSMAVAQTPAPRACAGGEFHALDFWIGEWVVRNSNGLEVGRSRIESILGGCALHEHWMASRGNTGESLTSYDPLTKRWRQHWIDGTGSLSDYTGDVDAKDVVLTAPGTDAAGKPLLYRMRFSPLPGGRVRQFIQQSMDGGSTWSLSFDGYYSHP
jgi:hypothetical protein